MKNTVAIDHVNVRVRNMLVKPKEVTVVRCVLESGTLERTDGNVEPCHKIQIEYSAQQSRSVTYSTAIIDRGAWLFAQSLNTSFQPIDSFDRKMMFVLAADG